MDEKRKYKQDSSVLFYISGVHTTKSRIDQVTCSKEVRQDVVDSKLGQK